MIGWARQVETVDMIGSARQVETVDRNWRQAEASGVQADRYGNLAVRGRGTTHI